MKIIPMQQGSEPWLEWRRSHITATDSSAIMGINPWKTPLQLFNEKLGFTEAPSINNAMKRGNELEPIARTLACEILNMNFEPIVCEHDYDTWMGASLDGYDKNNNIILEIKCPNIDTHVLCMNGSIKEYYMSQIQHQLYVSDAKQCIYFSYHPDSDQYTSYIHIDKDEEYIKEMLEMEKDFYFNHLCMMKPPQIWTFD